MIGSSSGRVLDNLLQSHLPGALIKRPNPWFDYQVRRLRQRGTNLLRDVPGYTRRWGCLYPGLLIFVSGLLLASTSVLFVYVVMLGVFINVGLYLLGSLFFAVITINTLRSGPAAIDWDLLRITLVSEEEIVAAQYAIAQIRAWRVMIPEMGIRAVVAGSGLLLLLSFATLSGPDISRRDLQSQLPVILPVVVLGVAFVLEPLWRMRTLTSIALELSMNAASATSAYLFAILAILGVILVEGLFVVVSVAGLIVSALGAYDGPTTPTDLWICGALGVVCLILYGFHQLVQRVSIQRTIRRLRRGE